MVVHSAAQLVNYIPLQQVLGSTVAAAGLWSVKAWAGGRKCVWERDWAGKMILIVVSTIRGSLLLDTCTDETRAHLRRLYSH